MDQINSLLELPQHEQRSEAWFNQRKNKLTSSDAASVLGINPYQTRNDVLFKKCGYDPKPFVGNVATLHGQKWEDPAIDVYCEKTNNINYNFGLIAHEDVYNNKEYYWLAGSPDGIVMDHRNKRAILIEVKCPYKRKIIFGKIPDCYMPQVQLNMFICKLYVADFIEYDPRIGKMNIVRIYRDEKWLKKNLPILEKFWKDVEYYREHGIENHPDFKPPKKTLDLRTEQNEPEEETELLMEFMIRD